MKDCVLGVDIGTSSCKVCAVDAAGALIGVAGAPYPILSGRPGWAEQDAREWMPAVARAFQRLRSEAPILEARIRALALSSAAHIGVLLDATDAALRPAILWNDQRATAESARLVEMLGDAIFAQACNQASPTWTLPQFLWVREHEPETWRQVRRICLSKDYVLHQLTGRLCTDPAAAVSSLLYDVRRGCWSEELCRLLGIGTEMLPEVVAVSEPVATLLPAAAARLGVPAGIPVTAGTLDSVAETYCAGAVGSGDCVIRLGTGGGVQLLRPGPVGHPKLISYPYPIAPLWLAQAGTNACGASMDWFGRVLESGSTVSPEELSRLAGTVAPGADGVVFHPYLLGERSPHWDGALRASFVGLSLSHGPTHLARAVLEGIAYSLKDAASLFEHEAGCPEPQRTTAVGGGTRSRILLQILADVLNQPLRVNPEADSAYGAALLALQYFQGTPSERVPARSRATSRLTPDPEASKRYVDGFAAFREIHQRLQGYYHERSRS